MAANQFIMRRGARTTRRALFGAPIAAAFVPDIGAPDCLLVPLPPLPQPQDWGESRTFLSRFHKTGERAVDAAEGALASPDDCQAIILGSDGVLRIVLPGGIAVSQLGVEVSG